MPDLAVPAIGLRAFSAAHTVADFAACAVERQIERLG